MTFQDSGDNFQSQITDQGQDRGRPQDAGNSHHDRRESMRSNDRPGQSPSDNRTNVSTDVSHQSPPHFNDVWNNYPDMSFNSPHENQCAMRLGYALNRSGFSLENYPRSESTWITPDGEKLPLGAQSLATFLTRQIGRDAGSVHFNVSKNEIMGRTGIVFFENIKGFRDSQGDHIDLWNGVKTKTGEYFNSAERVHFYELEPGSADFNTTSGSYEFSRLPSSDSRSLATDGTENGLDVAEQTNQDQTVLEVADVERSWNRLLNFTPSQTLQAELRSEHMPDWTIHDIDDGRGDVKFDYYPIAVERLPVISGERVTAEQFLDYLRHNFDSFIDQNLARFSLYDQSDSSRWLNEERTNALGVVARFDIQASVGGIDANWEDGSVVTSEITSNHWIFSTLWTIGDWGHPVSGNREFGFEIVDDQLVYYSRGVGRPTSFLDSFKSADIFRGSHRLFSSFQKNVADFINRNDGRAAIRTYRSELRDWSSVRSNLVRPRR